MSKELMSAIANKDGAAMARMAGGTHESGKVVNTEAERLMDSLFKQLKQIFPASVSTNLKTEQDERNAKRQWLAAFAENGIVSREQISAGVRNARASESAFWPSPGQFVRWCKDSSTVLGITIEDVMEEFHRYNRDKGLHTGGPEKFPWKKPVLYWIVCETRRAMYQRQLSEVEVEKYAGKQLDEWARKAAAGEAIPDPVIAIEMKKEVVCATPAPEEDDGKFRCMPNAAFLGAVTPAQWLMEEYKRRKRMGMVK